MTDMSTLLSRPPGRDLATQTPPIANGEVEVIGPVDGTTGEILPAAVPPSAPVGPPVAAVDPPTAFPLIPPKVLGGLPYASNYMKLAKTIHQTELVPKAFQGRPDAIMAAMMYGYELGLGPMQALNGLQPSSRARSVQDAELDARPHHRGGPPVRGPVRHRRERRGVGERLLPAQGLARRDPDSGVHLDPPERPGGGPGRVGTRSGPRPRTAATASWTWNPHGTDPRPQWIDGQQIKKASSWANYGEDMCIARATARAARANFADVLKGMSYTPEELAEFDGGNAGDAPQEVPPSPPPSTTENPSALHVGCRWPACGSDTPQGRRWRLHHRVPGPDRPPDQSSDGSKATSPAKKAAKAKPAAKKVTPIHTENAKDLPGAAVESTRLPRPGHPRGPSCALSITSEATSRAGSSSTTADGRLGSRLDPARPGWRDPPGPASVP